MGARAVAALAVIVLLPAYCVNAARISGSDGLMKDAAHNKQTPSIGCGCSSCKCSATKKPNFVFILVSGAMHLPD